MKGEKELDFVENLSVNLLSNLIWIVLTFTVVQIARYFVAGSGMAPVARPAQSPFIGRWLVECLRGLIRWAFLVLGLLAVLAVIVGTLVASDETMDSLLGWLLVLLTIVIWSWAIGRSRRPARREVAFTHAAIKGDGQENP
jgi:small-conductance mechanosensitive channel